MHSNLEPLPLGSRLIQEEGQAREVACKNKDCDGVVLTTWRGARWASQCRGCAARQGARTRQYNVQYAEWKQTEAYQRYLAAKEVVRSIRRPLIAQLMEQFDAGIGLAHHPERRDALDKLHPLPRPAEFGAPERPA